MDPVVSAPDPGLDTLGRLRAELGGSMAALEQALAAPAPGRGGAWAERVDAALVALAADFRQHVAATEGPDGLHGAVLATAPRLASSVHRLVGEHAVIVGLVDDLLRRAGDASTDARADADGGAGSEAGSEAGSDPGSEPGADPASGAIRQLGTTLLGRLARHRQQGADLIYQAYQVDLGGET
jgi:hypothetical protein